MSQGSFPRSMAYTGHARCVCEAGHKRLQCILFAIHKSISMDVIDKDERRYFGC